MNLQIQSLPEYSSQHFRFLTLSIMWLFGHLIWTVPNGF